MRNVGTVVRGIRTPIIRENDDLARIVVDSVINASISEGFKFRDKDVIAITEAVVGISEGNYATIDQIVRDLNMKFPSGEVGVVFPILSRNRFSMILKAIARAMKSITILLSFPKDEVGNGILDEEILNKSELNISSVISVVDYSKYWLIDLWKMNYMWVWSSWLVSPGFHPGDRGFESHYPCHIFPIG